jgi:carbonic anhydrase
MKEFFLLAGFSALIYSLFTVASVVGEEIAKIPPEVALKRLMDGNKRYTTDSLEHPNRSAMRREAISSNQTPFAVIVACSDSRVSPEIIFDQGLGDLFVVRVGGNVIGPIELASVEFAVKVLGASLVLVMGHENCGAVRAVMEGNTKYIEPIAERIRLDKNCSKMDPACLEKSIKTNATFAADELYKIDIIHEWVENKQLLIVGGYYHLSSGVVEICCDHK